LRFEFVRAVRVCTLQLLAENLGQRETAG
jgi:hypothetical protein